MKKADFKKVPNNLRKYRKAIGLKQKDVAKILSLKSAGMISRSPFSAANTFHPPRPLRAMGRRLSTIKKGDHCLKR